MCVFVGDPFSSQPTKTFRRGLCRVFPVYTCVFILMTQVRQQSEGEALCWGDYELFKIRWSLIIQHLVFKEDFELNSGFNFSQ